jgi:hypothetical protein
MPEGGVSSLRSGGRRRRDRVRWGAVAAAHPPSGMNGALRLRLRLKT